MESNESIDSGSPGGDPERMFLVRVAELLHAYGTPAYRLERVLAKMANSLGVQATFLSTPTSVFASFGAGAREETHLLRIDPGDVNLGKLVEFDQVMEDVEHGRSSVAAATGRLEAIALAPSRYPPLVTALAFGVASAAAARFFGGGLREVLVSMALGPCIAVLNRLLPRNPMHAGIYEPLAAFLVALTSLWIAAHWPPLDHRIVTLSSLIVLVPGLTLTTGMIELATRHLVSGVARLAGAAAIFLTILLGVALAWRVGSEWETVTVTLLTPLPPWTEWAALALAPLAFAVLLEARPREFGVILATGVLGFVGGRFGRIWLGPELGPFLGAFVVGLCSNLYARVLDRPASVPLTPGILLLVPGSLGYLSLTSFLDRDALVGMEGAFQTGMVAISLVGGLLASAVVVPPRRIL